MPPRREDDTGTSDAWNTVAQVLRAAAREAGALGVAAGRSIAAAYHAVDPDLRRHVGELPLLGWTHLAPRHRGVVKLPDDGHPPVVFVHGLGGHPGNFLPMRTWFRLMGRARTYAVSFSAGATLPQMAARLVRMLAEVRRKNGLAADAPVDLVAHSMGGIISRLALLDDDVAAGVRTLVTVGTPHTGTHLARLASTHHVRALRPGSATMKRLARQVPWKGPPRLVCIWSHADIMLLPASTGRLRGARSVPLEGLTHHGMLVDPRVWSLVMQHLSAPRRPRRR